MSLRAMAWAKDQRAGAPATKALLLCLADAHNDHTGLCCPSHERLAAEAEMSVRSVQEHLKRLVDAGLILVSRRDDGFGRRKTNAYRFPALAQPAAPAGRDPQPEAGRATTGNMLPVHEEREKDNGKEEGGAGSEIEEAVAEYQLMAGAAGLARIARLSGGRRAHLQARLGEHGLDTWRAAMRRVPSSAFLCGRNNRRWRPDFDWFVKPANFLKLIEGKYHDGKALHERTALHEGQALRDGQALHDRKTGRAEDAERERWSARLKAWARSDYWTGDWGAPPDDPRCEAPRDLIDLHRGKIPA